MPSIKFSDLVGVLCYHGTKTPKSLEPQPVTISCTIALVLVTFYET